ncbi:AAA family ATPase [Treponema sp.]|uniref:AAA family ATPase n=1 Tax=Treponema sp. TaxID=166 RepID=UPI003FA22404
MRPKTLVLRNIGPFNGEHTINFEDLGTLFLICGQTGAGKTMLFDAISYAFYGKPLGGRSDSTRNLRSHFADEYAAADVILTFSIGSQLYRIKRRLPYTKEGRKTESAEEVSLEHYENGSWVNQSSTNKKETDKSIENLIKLTDIEFSRIVLLPQGEFAHFLRASSNDKKNILMRLFPIHRYSELMDAAKKRSDQLQEEVQRIEANVKSMQEHFVYHRYESDHAELLNEIALMRDEHGSVLKALQTKNTELEQEKILADKRKELAHVQEELEACRTREDSIRALKETIQKAQRAAPLAVQLRQVRELEAACAADAHKIEETQQRLLTQTELIQGLQQRLPEITEKEQQRDSLYAVIDSLQKAAVLEQEIHATADEETKLTDTAAAAEAQLQESEAALAAAQAQAAALIPLIEAYPARTQRYDTLKTQIGLEKQLQDRVGKQEELTILLRSHTQAAARIRERLAALTKSYSIQTEQVALLDEEKRSAERQRTAASLAEQLEEGTPCPVCGSVHHPAPAHDSVHSAFSFDERIAEAKQRADDLQEQAAQAREQLAGAEAQTASYQIQYDECAAALESLEQQLQACGAAPFPRTKDEAKQRVKETSRQINEALQASNASGKAVTEKQVYEKDIIRLQHTSRSCEQQLQKLRQQLSSVTAVLQEKRRLFDRTFSQLPDVLTALPRAGAAAAETADAETALEQCEALLEELKLTVNAYHTDTAEATQKLEGIRGSLSAAQAHEEDNRQQLGKKQTQLEADYKKEGFAHLDELEQAVCSELDIRQWNEEVESFYEQYTAYKQAAAGLKKELSTAESRNLEELEAAVEALRQRYDEIQSRLEVLNAKKTNLEMLHTQYMEYTEALNTKTAEAQGWVSLAKDLTGTNPRKLQFDTWILSSFLHEVTEFANKRLERMSEGRYRLAVSEEQGSGKGYRGLDLEIADAYTGKCRPSATLSGGETFMASISLALGLADSLQVRAGGIRLDSMFIDEGFGTLDEKALENAIGILDEIRGDRMVGIISHVSELQSCIPQKIEVIKTGTGSSIKQIC